jgi:hypothetical protein
MAKIIGTQKQITELLSPEQLKKHTARSKKLYDELKAYAKEIRKEEEAYDKMEIKDTGDLDENLAEQLENNIKKLEIEREVLLRKIIGTLYNGTLIANELTFRNGEVFKYKERSPINSLFSIKTKINEHLHEIEAKLKKKNDKAIDVLEYVMTKIEQMDKNNSINSQVQYIFDNCKTKKIKLDEPLVIMNFETDYNDEVKSSMENSTETINGIMIDSRGRIQLYDEDDDISISDINEERIRRLYKGEVAEIQKGIVADLEKLKGKLEADIKEIKDKCSDRVMLLSLKNELNGTGNKN